MRPFRINGVVIGPVGGTDDMPNGASRIDRGIAGGRRKRWLIETELFGEKGRDRLSSAVTFLPPEPDHDDLVITEIQKVR
jgi:hypothetical protein